MFWNLYLEYGTYLVDVQYLRTSSLHVLYFLDVGKVQNESRLEFCLVVGALHFQFSSKGAILKLAHLIWISLGKPLVNLLQVVKRTSASLIL